MNNSRWSHGYLAVGRLRAVSIRFHWSLFAAVVVSTVLGWPFAALAVVLLTLGHEMGHVLVVRARGLHVLGVDLNAVGGQCIYQSDGASNWDRALIAWGGVLFQLAVFVPLLLWVKYQPVPDGWFRPILDQSLAVLLPLNALVIFLNLIPVAPLDGAQAWNVFSLIPERIRARRQAGSARRANTTIAADTKRKTVAARAKAKGFRVVSRSDPED